MRARLFFGVTVTAVAGILLGCASTSSERKESTTSAATHEHKMGMMGATCPMLVPGTTASANDVEGGIAVSFTTSTGDVADLRQRVRAMAAMHNQHHSGPGAHMGGSGGMMSSEMMMPSSRASVEDIPGGARIVLVPGDPAQLEALRQQARTHTAQMTEGECPMMTSPPGSEGAEHEAHHPPK